MNLSPRVETDGKAEGAGAHLVVAGLALGWAVLYLDRSILFPLLPAIAEEFDLTGTQRGAISSAYFVTYVAMQIPSGVLGDRLGLKNVLMGMYLLIGLGLLGIGALSASYLLLLVFVAVQGFGAGAFYSGSYGITISAVPARRRGAASAVVTSGMAVGSALGLGLAGVLYALADSWRAPYLIMLGPTLAAVAFMAILIGRVPRPATAQGGIRYLLTSRDMMGLGIANFCGLYAYMVVFTWGPSFLVDQHGLSVTRAGLLVALVAVASLVGALTWGRLSDRVGRKPLTLSMFALSAGVVALIPVVGSGVLLVATLFAYGLFGALAWNPILVAWVGDRTFASRRVGMGTTMGVMNTVGISSAFVAPVVSGWISDVVGSLSWAFYAGALVVAVGIPATTLVKDAALVDDRASEAPMAGREPRRV